jgi:acyl-CoA synthetase
LSPTERDLAIVDPEVVAAHVDAGWWDEQPLAAVVGRHARERPAAPAFITPTATCTWLEYDVRSAALAEQLVTLGLGRGERVAVLVPDGAEVHIAYLACEKAGLTVVGLGTRTGDKEVAHLLRRTEARAIITGPEQQGRAAEEWVADLRAAGVPLEHHLVVSEPPAGSRLPHVTGESLDGRGLGPNDLFLVNSTSGTTGMPKCVLQHQNRWFYFHRKAVAAGRLGPDDCFLSVVPAPFGFGLWTAHVTPTLLGAPTVLVPRFDAAEAVALAATHGVTVAACVSTQFILMLASGSIDGADLRELRVVFTGGEAVPRTQAAAFEEQTGALMLQFFGSNETGALSCTTLDDDADQRLGSSGRVIPEMQVRLFGEDGSDITATGGPGQPAGRGPATCVGYLEEEANAELFTPDGWMLMADLVTVDPDGYLRVVGRKSDLIIRGGKNISAAEVEAEVGTHPSVRTVAAVAVPDEVFGERTCVVVALRDGASLSLGEVVRHLADRGVGKHLYPEHLLVVDELPSAPGGKVAKGEVRSLAEEAARTGATESAVASRP